MIVEAYAQLVAEGYLLARTREETRVADGLVQPSRRAPAARVTQPRVHYDLRAGIPDLSLFPRLGYRHREGTA